MSKPIPPMDDFWKQMLQDLQCFTDKPTYYGVHYEVCNRELNIQWFLQHVIKLLKLRLERDKHE